MNVNIKGNEYFSDRLPEKVEDAEAIISSHSAKPHASRTAAALPVAIPELKIRFSSPSCCFAWPMTSAASLAM